MLVPSGLEPGLWYAGGCWFLLSSIAISVSVVSKKAANGVIFGRICGRGALLMVVGRLLLFLKQGRVGVGGCLESSFSFF